MDSRSRSCGAVDWRRGAETVADRRTPGLRGKVSTWAAFSVLLAVAGGGIAWAESERSTPTPPGAASGKGESHAEKRERFAADRDEFLAGVAERLGVDVDELKEAIEAEALERVDAAVAEGRLSEKQADRIRERIASGRLPFGPGVHPGRGGPRGERDGRAPYGHEGKRGRGALKHVVIEAAGDYLGAESRELFRARREGKSLARLAEEKGKSADGLAAAVLEAATERLDRAVADGRLTKEKADRLRERAGEAIPRLLERARRR
jgi:ribosomal protein S20